MRAVFILLFSLLSVFASKNAFTQAVEFTEEEREYISNNQVVMYGYDPYWKPLEFKENGTHSGVTRDFLNMLEQLSGLKFEPHPDIEEWSDAERLFDEGEIIMLPTVGATEQRAKRMNFTETYLSHPFVIVTQKEGDFIGSVSDFEGKKVALPKGYTITSYIEKEPFPIKIIYKPDLESCMMAVATQEADATAGNLCVVSHYLNYSGFNALKIAAPTGYQESEFHMGVSKDHPMLLEILDKCIRTINPKTKNDILNDWISVTYEFGVDMAKVWRIAIISGLIVLTIVLIIVYWNRKLKKEVERRKQAEEELQASFDEINYQKALIEEQHKEIKDSITYAKRIQEAILPPERVVQEKMQKSFILYKPKAIVAGDFYWMEEVNGQVIFAAADCTGHGVPGAMMSVVCHNALNRSVREFGFTDPAKILDKTRELVIETFEASDEEVKDGMDIALCNLNTQTHQLQYAGANNSLVLIKKETKDLESVQEIKADKQPIGKYADKKPFTSHTLQLEEGDSIYVFSDGFPDQFGGSMGKKFKYKPFRKLLLDNHTKPMDQQHQILENTFEEWKGELEQIDDVCVIGVRV